MDIDTLFKTPLLIVGAIGSSLTVLSGDKKPKTFKEYLKVTGLILSGSIITNFLTPLLIHYVPSLQNLEASAGLVVGLFGIGVIGAILKVITKLNTDFFGTIKSFKDILNK